MAYNFEWFFFGIILKSSCVPLGLVRMNAIWMAFCVRNYRFSNDGNGLKAYIERNASTLRMNLCSILSSMLAASFDWTRICNLILYEMYVSNEIFFHYHNIWFAILRKEKCSAFPYNNIAVLEQNKALFKANGE